MGRLRYYSMLSGQAPQESAPPPAQKKKIASHLPSARYFSAFSFNTSIEIQMNHVASLETAVTFAGLDQNKHDRQKD